MALEDSVTDIVNKARRGLGLTVESLATATGLPTSALQALFDGEPTSFDIRPVSRALGLDPAALIAIQRGRYEPDPGALPAGFAVDTTRFGDMDVNAFLIWDAASGSAALFDTGASAANLLAKAQTEGARLTDLFLTHTHPDHVADVAHIVSKTGARVHVDSREAGQVPGALPFVVGTAFTVGSLFLSTFDGAGHSPGQVAWLVTGLARPVAIVGDVMFAGSMGGPRGDYRAQLRLARTFLRALPPDTLIAPGHGPLTTAAAERVGNPFLADSLADS